MTVLVVAEDDDDIRAVTARILRRAGYTVAETADGAAALQAVREYAPAAVVSDIDMPVMSGVELCRQLRAAPATKNLPVIFVSGSLMPDDTRPVDAQATATLLKPFTASDLVACVQKALQSGHHEGQDPSVCP